MSHLACVMLLLISHVVNIPDEKEDSRIVQTAQWSDVVKRGLSASEIHVLNIHFYCQLSM